jgi:hypothetical protein
MIQAQLLRAGSVSPALRKFKSGFQSLYVARLPGRKAGAAGQRSAQASNTKSHLSPLNFSKAANLPLSVANCAFNRVAPATPPGSALRCASCAVTLYFRLRPLD